MSVNSGVTKHTVGMMTERDFYPHVLLKSEKSLQKKCYHGYHSWDSAPFPWWGNLQLHHQKVWNLWNYLISRIITRFKWKLNFFKRVCIPYLSTYVHIIFYIYQCSRQRLKKEELNFKVKIFFKLKGINSYI